MQATVRIFLETLTQQFHNERGCFSRQQTPVGHCFEDGFYRLRDRVARKGRHARQTLIQDTAESPDVGALINGFTACLLGTHIGCRPEDQPCVRDSRTLLSAAAFRGQRGINGTESFRQTKIQNLRGAVGTKFDVRRLEIAMDDPAFMRSFQSFRDLLCKQQHFTDRNTTAPDAARKRWSFNKFEDERLHCIRAFDSIDSGDIRVIQSSEDLCFTPEGGKPGVIPGGSIRSHLERYITIKLGIVGTIDLAHAAGTDKFQNRIGTQGVVRFQHTLVCVGNRTYARRYGVTKGIEYGSLDEISRLLDRSQE
jgi:hypothetical protein